MKTPHLLLATLAASLATSNLSPIYAEAPSQALVDRQAKIKTVMTTSAKAVVGIAGIGSGVVVSKDGTILTAAHVLDALIDPETKELVKEFPVFLADGRVVDAKILGRNRDRDSAMAKITTPGEYAFVELAEPASLKEGEWCIAMGHPGGFQKDRTAPVRLGRVWEKDDKKFHKSDCTVSGGDSGGPLFSLEGKLIGIHSNIGERLDENRHVPIGTFKDTWDKLEKGEDWGRLGKLMPELERFERNAPKDRKQEPEKPSEKPSDKPKEMREPAPQNNKESDAGPAPAGGRATLGVALDQEATNATVAEVAPGSAANKAGIQAGDVILKLGDSKIESASQLVETVRRHRPGTKLQLNLKRGDAEKTLEVTLGGN